MSADWKQHVYVRKVGPRWGWRCLPDCLDSSVSTYGDPGRAADAGREHYRLWHTDLPDLLRGGRPWRPAGGRRYRT